MSAKGYEQACASDFNYTRGRRSVQECFVQELMEAGIQPHKADLGGELNAIPRAGTSTVRP
jgi:hypothetical protein